MIQKFDWMEEATEAIREHFRNRNAARGRQGKRVVLRKKFVDLLANGDLIHSYTYGGETVTMTKKAYSYEVEF